MPRPYWECPAPHSVKCATEQQLNIVGINGSTSFNSWR